MDASPPQLPRSPADSTSRHAREPNIGLPRNAVSSVNLDVRSLRIAATSTTRVAPQSPEASAASGRRFSERGDDNVDGASETSDNAKGRDASSNARRATTRSHDGALRECSVRDKRHCAQINKCMASLRSLFYESGPFEQREVRAANKLLLIIVGSSSSDKASAHLPVDFIAHGIMTIVNDLIRRAAELLAAGRLEADDVADPTQIVSMFIVDKYRTFDRRSKVHGQVSLIMDRYQLDALVDTGLLDAYDVWMQAVRAHVAPNNALWIHFMDSFTVFVETFIVNRKDLVDARLRRILATYTHVLAHLSAPQQLLPSLCGIMQLEGAATHREVRCVMDALLHISNRVPLDNVEFHKGVVKCIARYGMSSPFPLALARHLSEENLLSIRRSGVETGVIWKDAEACANFVAGISQFFGTSLCLRIGSVKGALSPPEYLQGILDRTPVENGTVRNQSLLLLLSFTSWEPDFIETTSGIPAEAISAVELIRANVNIKFPRTRSEAQAAINANIELLTVSGPDMNVAGLYTSAMLLIANLCLAAKEGWMERLSFASMNTVAFVGVLGAMVDHPGSSELAIHLLCFASQFPDICHAMVLTGITIPTLVKYLDHTAASHRVPLYELGTVATTVNEVIATLISLLLTASGKLSLHFLTIASALEHVIKSPSLCQHNHTTISGTILANAMYALSLCASTDAAHYELLGGTLNSWANVGPLHYAPARITEMILLTAWNLLWKATASGQDVHVDADKHLNSFVDSCQIIIDAFPGVPEWRNCVEAAKAIRAIYQNLMSSSKARL